MRYSFRSGRNRELIKDGVNGIVIKSFEELKDAIIKLLSSQSDCPIGIGSKEDNRYMAFLGRTNSTGNRIDKQFVRE